jgi:hypothetical protein
VEVGLELAGQVVGCGDGEVLERPLGPHLEGDLGSVAEVLAGVGLEGVRVVAAPVALAPGAGVAGDGLEHLRPIDQLAQLEHEHAGPLAVGQEDSDGLVLAQDRLELADRRDVVDHHPGRHGHRQLDDLPQSVGGAGEDRQAPRARPVDAAADQPLDLRQVGLHRCLPVRPRPGPLQDHLDLVLEVLVAGDPSAVDVEVTGRDRCPLPLHRSQLPDPSFGDDRHGRLLVAIR